MEQTSHNHLVILRGPGGVGKSTVGDALEDKIGGAYHLDVDELKKQTFHELPMETRRKLGRDAANLYLEDALGRGGPIIVSECFVDVEYLESVRNLAKASENQYLVHQFYIDGDVEICVFRNRQRESDLTDAHIRERYNQSHVLPEDIKIENEEGKLDSAVGHILANLY